MVEATYKAIVLSAKDYKENDKLLRLLTPSDGIITAIMRGVKKPSAKLRFGALPFAFAEYSLVKKSDIFVVTGCAQIEDIFAISEDFDSYTMGCIMLECAGIATGVGISPEVFITLLRSLKLLLYSTHDPYLIAIAYIQKLIHGAGYGYVYPEPVPKITSVMSLLTLLNATDLQAVEHDELPSIDKALIQKTLKKLIENFEGKFDTAIQSKKLLIS